MRFARIAVVLCVCLYVTSADVSHLRAAKARLAARLVNKVKHHKRGILSHVPPYKLGHDIPLVTHSVVKPLVVTYPPTAAVAAVKVPLAHPLIHRFPVPVGHKVPVPHPHYGLKFPHHTNAVLWPKPDHHFHHHHHHLEPKPAIPVVPPVPVPATPLVPVGQPTGTIATPIPAPPPSVAIHPAPVLPAQPLPVFPPSAPVLPSSHIDIKPLLPAASVPLQPAVVPFPSFPLSSIPLAHQYPYVIRPGNAVQTSYFATYPRYPLVNYNSPLIPLAAPIAPGSVGQVLYDRPNVPSFHLVPQEAAGDGVVPQPVPGIHVDPTPTIVHPTQVGPHVTAHLQPTQPTLHLHPTQPTVPLDNGWSPLPSHPQDLSPTSHPEVHFSQPQDVPQFTQQQGTQVFEHHSADDQQYHDYQHHLQHHIQQQIEQSQYEQHLNNQHQLGNEYGVPQQVSHEYGQPNQEFAQHAQVYENHAQEYAQNGQDYAQHGQEYAQHEQEYAQQDYNLHQQPNQEYGVPQPEGRSSEGEGEAQRYHNHIPLGLQPPIDRPLEHFR